MFLKFLPFARTQPLKKQAGDRGKAGGAAGPKLGGLYVNMWRHAAGARIRLALTWVALIGAALLELMSPWLGSQALNALQENGAQGMTTAAWYGVAILAAAVLAWSLHGPARVSERRIALRVRRNFTNSLYAKLMRLPLAWHEGHHSGEVQQRLSQAALALYSFTQSQFSYIKAVVHFLGAAVAITLFSPMLGACALLGYSVVGLIMMRFDLKLMRLAKEENAAERKFQSRLLDFLGNFSTLLSFRMQDSSRRLLVDRLAKVFEPVRKSITLVEVKWCIADLSSIALTWSLVAAAVWLSRRDGAILIGGIFLVHQYAQQSRMVVLALADKFQTVARSRTDLASVEAILIAADQAGAGCAIAPDWRRIDVRGLSYEHGSERGYELCGELGAPLDGRTTSGLKQGLKEIHLTLHRSDRIALVGPSGAGKSTLMRVLAGQYHAGGECIAIDGAISPATPHLGSIATFIAQEADVFEASIRDNISLSGEHSEDEIRLAIEASAFDAVMADMGLGLDTPLSERGCNLSGGQRQRLCLARGLLAARGSSLMFLDEPTSALDPITEHIVLGRIAAALPDACIVASIHRMELLQHFNKVVLMANGRVQDVGTVEELLVRQPAFREMLSGRGAELRPVELLEQTNYN
jgi:ATP-binding cassette subfamily B protein